MLDVRGLPSRGDQPSPAGELAAPVRGYALRVIRPHRTHTVGRRVWKAIVDPLVASLLLLALLPIWLIVAVAVKVGSPGPILFRQTRVGLGGRHFTCLKFRTMRVGAEHELAALLQHNEHDGVLFKMRADPRVTAVGRRLREWSLDELPQLLNVLRGDMSLVGPRPALPDEVDRFEADLLRRLHVKPGLTGLWQVNGRADLAWEDAVRYDLTYVDEWTPWLDVRILGRTLGAVLRRHGAY